MTALSWSTIILAYVCPSIGAVLAGIMFAAPVEDLRRALVKGSLGPLNPVTWAFTTGNCLGWCAYAYYTRDPFVFAANLPGLIISFWLNLGASKLQYLELIQEKQQEAVVHSNASSATMVPQETLFLRILVVWSFVLVWVGWLYPSSYSAHVVGLVVNINLVAFYGAPLHTIMTVIETKCSDSIHVPTMVLNWTNTSFWLAYSVARRDPVIMVPNGLGLMLGIVQGLLSLWFPRSGRQVVAQGEDDSVDEEARDMLVV